MTIPDSITSAELQTAIHALRVRLISQPDGSVLGVPIDTEGHGNQGLVRIPRHRRQISAHRPGPEAA